VTKARGAPIKMFKLWNLFFYLFIISSEVRSDALLQKKTIFVIFLCVSLGIQTWPHQIVLVLNIKTSKKKN
jgi:hypothetical protein